MQALDRKPAAVDRSGISGSSENPFLMLGTDLMVAVVTYLEPRETLSFLTVPLCKEWRFSYTADQELWRTISCSEPFCADMTDYSASIEASSAEGESGKDTDDNPLNSLDDYKDALRRKNILVGEYRLVYTSFVRCMKYLDQIQNNDPMGLNNAQEQKGKRNEIKFPTFGVTKSLKRFLSRNDREALRSVIRKGSTDDIPSSPIGVSTDGREIHKDTFFKKGFEKDDSKKPKYAQSVITKRLWGPTATGVPSHLNLPKTFAIYSIINWMVAHPNVRGIQIMCIKALPDLLDDEQQRVIGRRVGLVEVIMCAMLRFPNCIDLHIAVFHAIVLLARPLGGREGMLFNDGLAEAAQNIGLTSCIELSDSMSLAARCGGHPSLEKGNQATTTSDNSTRSHDFYNEDYGKRTGIAILLESMSRFSHSEKLQSMACWALVNVALVPLQKNMLMKLGGIEAVLSAMERHSDSFDVQFRALFSLINLAVPCHESDFVFDSINAADATLQETLVLNSLRAKIATLSIAAMKKFSSSESILNRGCLVIHNLSRSPECIRMLLDTPDCPQMLRYCLENHSTDKVLRRSVYKTLQRMHFYLDQHPEIQDPMAMRAESPFEQVW